LWYALYCVAVRVAVRCSACCSVLPFVPPPHPVPSSLSFFFSNPKHQNRTLAITWLPATHCTTLQHTAPHYTKLPHTATHCNTLQHTATHCNTLQYAATLHRSPPRPTTSSSVHSKMRKFQGIQSDEVDPPCLPHLFSLSLSLSLSLYLCLSVSLSPSLSHSLSRSLARSLALSHALSLFCSHSYALSRLFSTLSRSCALHLNPTR